jgi:hypothetical protein
MTIKLMRRRLLLTSAVLWIGVVPLLRAQTAPTIPPDFAPLGTLIDSLRSGSEAELSIKFDENMFTVQQTNRSTISAETGSELDKADSIQDFPGFRIDDGKFFLVKHVAESTWVEQELIENTAGARWNKRTLDPVASYPLDDWTEFIDFAVSQGLVQYGSFSTENKTFGYLVFASKGVPSVAYNAGTLQLSDDFYRTMRLSPKYPPAPGAAGFVIIVHDPHADVAGRFALLRGLDSLYQGNAGTKFCFLNEGEFPGANPTTLSARLISDGGVHAKLQALTPQSRKSAIYKLLGNFQMDVPRAYQELHFDRRDPTSKIADYKIDDIRYLHEPLIDRVSDAKFDSALQVIFDAARSGVASSKDAALTESKRHSLVVFKQVIITAAMERADVGKMSDEESIDFYNLLSEQLKELVQGASVAFPQSPKVSSAVATLDSRIREHSLDAITFSDAIKRNRTMSRLMVTAAKAPATYGGIPIAFIGSFHTKGITSVLRENNIGYVVIEPARSTIFRAPESEERSFAQFVAKRSAFLRAPGYNKGAAELAPAEVQQYVIPKVQHAAQWHDTQVAAIASKIDPSSTIDPRKLSTSILDNPYSIYTSIDVGGSGQLPPNIPKGAFAFYEPFGDGLRLRLLGVQDEQWKADDSRYRFLSLVTARIPEKDASNPSSHWVEAMTLNSQDRAAGKAFVSYYDGQGNRLWLVETSMGAVSSLVSRPVKKGAQTVEFGLTTAELDRDTTKEGDRDADGYSGSGSEN